MHSQRILLIGSLLLFFCGIGYGTFYQIFLNTSQQYSLEYNLAMALNMAVKGDMDTAAAFAEEYQTELTAREVHRQIPLHLMFAGAITAVALVAGKHMDTSEGLQRSFALLIITGGLVLTIGDLLTLYGSQTWGLITTVGGFSWLALGVAGYLLYVLLYIWLHQPRRHNCRHAAKTDSRNQ